jgi:2-polyprenyl-6-methoxyphenol hydroxylase-like FAD-dependent oxidoreductase
MADARPSLATTRIRPGTATRPCPGSLPHRSGNLRRSHLTYPGRSEAPGRSPPALLGDALAPVRPHTARGANNGIEQAAGLTAALAQHRKHGADLAAALRGWQHRHLPTAAHWVTRGPHIGARLGLGLELGLDVDR